MVAEGKPLPAITVTQLRMRLGGGSWQTLREELERAQEHDRGDTEAVSPNRLDAEVPSPLAGQAAALEQLLARAGTELRALVAAVREHDRREHEREVAALRAEIDDLRRQLAASPVPPRTTTKGRRRIGGGAS